MADRNATNIDPDGRYTNIEMYWNSLVQDIVIVQNK